MSTYRCTFLSRPSKKLIIQTHSKDGAIAVPTGPGLGVKLDEEKMRRYEKYFEEKGDYYARFHQDPRRPEWYPLVGGT